MDATVVNVLVVLVAFAAAFGIVRTVVKVRARRHSKLEQAATSRRHSPAPRAPRNKNKRRRLDQHAQKAAKGALRQSRNVRLP